MDTECRCRRCGNLLPAGALRGLCPVCLLHAGLHGGDSAGAPGPVGTTITRGSASAGALATLAESLGGLPRVLLHDTEPEAGPAPVVQPGSPEMPEPADRLPRLQLLGEIGRGGMGAVLKGRDPDLGRDLAIKVLLERHRDRPELVRRFIEEAQIAGQLQHPGIVPIHELGAFADRRPYFAMKLVKGRTLAGLLQDRPAPAADLPWFLGIFESICQTMAYAHARGVIHRDLKPSNVMVGGFGEVQVMDWGLAKVLPRGGRLDDETAGKVAAAEEEGVITTVRSGSNSEPSQAGSVMGTPSYMAPEQARGEVEAIDERGDVFALGSILAEVLTGRPAYTGRDATEIQRKAMRGDLAEAFARLDACGADPGLIALARECLAADRGDRLRDARAVSGRITAYLAGVQERLRAAELARVEAQTRADEEAKRRVLSDALARQAQAHALAERKRRRLQLGLAAAILALMTLPGLIATASRQRRQSQAARVELALAESTVLRDQARQAADDPGRWQAAREAVKRVEVALGDSDDARALRRLGDLRREVEAGTEAARRDRELLETLADIRSAQIDLGRGETDASYAAAFRRAGIDIDALPPAQAAARLRARPACVALPLAGVLDDWTGIRRAAGQPAGRWRRPLAVARAADPDPYRDRLRDLAERDDLKTSRQALQALSQDPRVAELSPTSTLLLADVLRQAGDLPEAVAVLERAVQQHPGDVWINYNLGMYLNHLPTPRREEALRYFTAARALRPESAHDLAHSLDQMGRSDEAIRAFRALARVRPAEARHLGCLGKILVDTGHREEGREVLDRAIAAAREAIRRRPDDAGLYHNLGFTLEVKGDRAGAIAAYREAHRIKPENNDLTRNSLINLLQTEGDASADLEVNRVLRSTKPGEISALMGRAARLGNKGNLEGAVAAYREAILLDPHHSPAYANLALVLRKMGDLDGAIAASREAIRRTPDRYRASANLASYLQAKGDLDGAIAAYREAIRIKPDHVPSHAGLFKALEAKAGLGRATTEYREVLRLVLDDFAAQTMLGRALTRLGDRDGAIAAYREAIRLKPDDAMAHFFLGNALGTQGQLEAAVAAYRESILLDPDLAVVLDNLGNALETPGRQDAAIARYREAIRLKPDDAGSYVFLGDGVGEQGQLDVAVGSSSEATRLTSDDAMDHLKRGQYLVAQGQRDAAAVEFREAIRLKPSAAGSHFFLGNALATLGRRDAAVVEYREAIRLKPDLAVAHHNLGNSLGAQGQCDGAIAAYREAIRLKPGFSVPHFSLGDAVGAQGRLDAAVAAAREAVRLKPDDAMAHSRLGNALASQGWLDAAVAEYREAIRLKPDDATAHRFLGSTLAKQGDFDAALAEYREAVRLKPTLPMPHVMLGMDCVLQEKYEEAIAALREAIRLKPDDAGPRHNISVILERQGQLDAAAAECREVIRLRPGDVASHHRLGGLLASQGQVDAAAAEYRELIRLKPDFAVAHCDLGQVLRRQGRYAEALDELRTGHALGSKQRGWREPSADLVAQAECLVALGDRLPAILRGDDHPKNTAERLAVAQVYSDANRPAAAARLWAEVLGAETKPDDKLRAARRHAAARDAARAGCGQGRDDPAPDDRARAKLRGQALEWLWSELTRLTQHQGTNAAASDAMALKQWTFDPDLAGVRDPGPLAALPEAERDGWRALWGEVDRLLDPTGRSP